MHIAASAVNKTHGRTYFVEFPVINSIINPLASSCRLAWNALVSYGKFLFFLVSAEAFNSSEAFYFCIVNIRCELRIIGCIQNK